MAILNIDACMKEIDERLNKQNIDVLNHMMAGRDVWYRTRTRATVAVIIAVISLIANILTTVAIWWICI